VEGVEEAEAPRENPRTRRVRALMLETAVEVLLKEGAAEVTALRIAERADVARTTVYRQWPDQRSLLLATIAELTRPHHQREHDGPLDEDLRATLGQLRERLVRREVRSVFGALAAQATQDEAFRDAQRLFVRQLTQPVAEAFEAAVERGEVPATLDPVFEADLLAGPMLHCHLVCHHDVTEALVEEVFRRWQLANSA